MRKPFEKGGAEQKMFREFYEIAEDYFIPEESDEYWESYIARMHEFINNNIPFARNLERTFTYYLEAELNRKRGTENANA